MARVKSDKLPVIRVRDWQHADELVREIAGHQLVLQQLEARAKRKIDSIKADMVPQVNFCQRAINNYLESLEAFAASHQCDFGKSRSRRLNFGILGWRKSTSIKTKKNTLERIKKVFSKADAAACIRIKESVDRDALARLKDQQLASVGARREVTDVFFVEPNKTKAVDYHE